jgi:hypothetical protein
MVSIKKQLRNLCRIAKTKPQKIKLYNTEISFFKTKIRQGIQSKPQSFKRIL